MLQLQRLTDSKCLPKLTNQIWGDATIYQKGFVRMARTKLPRGTKTKFIKDHPNLSAKEVVDAAAKEGIQLTAAAVYNIRSAAKKSKGAKGRPGHRKGRKGRAQMIGFEIGNGHHLTAAVDFCRVSGGIEQARKAIATLESLQLS